MDGINEEFLHEIFDRQPGKYICLSRKSNGSWRDVFFRNMQDALKWLKYQSDDCDLYFCPTKFEHPRRKKENAAGSFFLWADLDEVNPDSIKPNLDPSHAWESSPGRFQALWELPKVAEPKEVEERNKGLAYEVGADKSGWDLTQVLRIPGTINHKYPTNPKVKFLWSRPDKIRDVSVYPYVNGKTELKQLDLVPFEIPDKKAGAILRKYHNHIPRNIQNMITSKVAEKGKRSDILWYLGHKLAEIGLKKGEVYVLLKASVWNKYRGRTDEVKRLIHEINSAFEDVSERREIEEKSFRSEFDIEPLRILSHTDFMANQVEKPGWLVDKFWATESHGIVAGEPKSFKSTFLMDFVVSIASGKPFLNSFKVNRTGPILLIQNENSDWIMQDRIRKIMKAKQLLGKFYNYNEGALTVSFPKDLPIYYINQQGFSFADPQHTDLVEKFIQKHKPVVTVFDPLYLMFSGDINSAKELNPILTWLLFLKQSYQTTPILVHHWNKAGFSKRGGQRMLGSTVLHGWIESAWYLSVTTREITGEDNKDDEDFTTPSARAVLTLEREFRGAGLFPKVDIVIDMGEMGDTRYKISMERHREEHKQKVSRVDASDDVIKTLINTKTPMSLNSISKACGIGRRIVKEVLEKLLVEKKVLMDGDGYLLVREKLTE